MWRSREDGAFVLKLGHCLLKEKTELSFSYLLFQRKSSDRCFFLAFSMGNFCEDIKDVDHSAFLAIVAMLSDSKTVLLQ